MELVEQVVKKAMEVGLQAIADVVLGPRSDGKEHSVGERIDVLLSKEVEVEVTILDD